MASTFPATFSPEQSAALLAELARPSFRYRRHAWLAMGSLVLFMAGYVALAGWFLFAVYRMVLLAILGGGGVATVMSGLCAAFLAFFLIKAVFFIKRGGTGDCIEVTAAQQPVLFDFLNRLADSAGAPRPHRVFLSPRVNAAVFYDLSLVNLFFPSKKNLEIGLGLVNALSFSELRAVLAHEFGHFAQRAMAVGRWVYVVQQIAAHLVVHRDKLDGALRTLSRVDFRIAWIGWVLSLIVWSIRSLVDSAFTLVVLLQRALSREMEFQADLVAVSLTGSDALVHALHRLQAADDSWDRTVGFARGERDRKRPPRDLFALQSRIMARMAEILNDPSYAPIPAVPAESAASHRLFTASFAEPPRMWRTHPLNHEREANAKRRYVPAAADDRSAWELFAAPEQLRESMSALVLDQPAGETVPLETSLAQLDRSFNTERLKERYRGVYLGRSITRHAAAVVELYDGTESAELAAIDALYPPALAADADQLRALHRELDRLKALQSGALEATGGRIRHRGADVSRKRLPAIVTAVAAELQAAEQCVSDHDRHCRSLHRAAAAQLGGNWAPYLEGLLALVHYTEHTDAQLRDAQAVLRSTIAIETATRQVGSGGITRILNAANDLFWTLEKVFGERGAVVLDKALAERTGIADWAARLGEFRLNAAARGNLNDWLKVIDAWVDQAADPCSLVQAQALDLLLITEAALAEHLRQGTAPEPAPDPSRVPASYATLLPGGERKRPTQLDPWARFRTGSGAFYATARLAAAGAIVAAVLSLGWAAQMTTLTIYNGLARPLSVRIGSDTVLVGAFGTADRRVAPFQSYRIEARTREGALVDALTLDDDASSPTFIYNVAGAGPLVELTARYGTAQEVPPRFLGAPAVTTTRAEFRFTDAPASVSMSRGQSGTTRLVLSGAGDAPPQRALSMVSKPDEQKRLIGAHARWDGTETPHTAEWLAIAGSLPGFDTLLAERLAERPDDIVLRRAEQDAATAATKPALCDAQSARARQAPDNPDLQYLALRCLPETPAKNQGFLEAHRRWPQNGWLAFATAYGEAENGHWQAALDPMEQAFRTLPAMRSHAASEIARIKRMLDPTGTPNLDELSQQSEELEQLLALETGTGITRPSLKAYSSLAKGQLKAALDLAHTDPDSEARLLRLAAGSDGADPALVERALALDPEAGIDASTLWAAIGLGARGHRDISAYLKQTEAWGDQVRPLLTFIQGLQAGQRPEAVEKLLDGLQPELRGQGYVIGLVLLGQHAPRAWRDGAKRLLFASERPYFS